MTLEESKELETKIANDILNNVQFSLVVEIISAEAQARAKKFVSEATPEQLTEVKEKMEEAEAEREKAAAAKTPDRVSGDSLLPAEDKTVP